MLVRNPLFALDRLESVELHHAARRLEVVEDRLVAGEALEPHHLFGEERPVLAELDVPLAGDVAEALVERHRRSLTQGQLSEPTPYGGRAIEATAGARRAVFKAPSALAPGTFVPPAPV